MTEASKFDLGIRCGFFLSMKNGSTAVERDWFIGVHAGRFASVEPWNDARRAECAELIDASEKLVMPGLINAHTHLPMTLLRGLAEDQPFLKWLNDVILPIEEKLLDANLACVGTELALWESLLSGVTTVCDMYYFGDSVAGAVDRAGMRGLMGEAIVDFSAPDNKARDGGDWRILDRMRERYARHPRIIPCVAPHAPYTCSDETLARARDYAELHSMPLLIHVSETRQEVEASMKAYGCTPVERLDRLGVTGSRSVFVHCVHATGADIAILSDTRTSVVYNPESNMKLSSGVAPVPAMRARGIAVGIGTDGAASNNDLNLFHEMDSGVKLQKIDETRAGAFTAADALRLATIEGARALGIADRVGSIEDGKAADCIVVDVSAPAMQPRYDIPSQLVYAASGAAVDTVVCDGKILLRGRKPLTLEVERVRRDVAAAAMRIREFL